VPERVPFEYALLRVVPRVERGECLNAGVLLVCRPRRFLQAQIALDLHRLRALAPYLDDETIAQIERQVGLVLRIAAGEPDAGPIAKLGLGERWHWLTAPTSTIVQPGPVHTGLLTDPAACLDHLLTTMVATDHQV
jgi:hypothetical protein